MWRHFLTWTSILSALQFGCSSDAASPSGAQHAPTLRAYATLPVSKADEVAVTAIDTVANGRETLVVYGEPIFTEEDVVGAEQVASANVTEFRLGPDGTEALRSFTSRPGTVGNRMALLFGSRWAGFPMVQAEIRNGRFVIVDLSQAEVTQAIEAFSPKE